MKELIFSLFSNLGQKLAAILLVGTAAVTTTTAYAKILGQPKKDEQTQTEIDPTSTPQPSITPEVIDKVVTEIITVTPSPTKKINPTATLTPTPIRQNIQTNTTPAPTITPISGSHEDLEDEKMENDDQERSDSGNQDRYIEDSGDRNQNEVEDSR